MTELQEIILDHLMAAEKIGTNWLDGPLGLAVQALPHKPQVRGSRYGRRYRDIARALGYPALYCEAFQGASSILPGPDERRKLAVTLFGEVPPRTKLPRVSAAQYVASAQRMALRAHALVCSGPCPLRENVTALVRGEYGRGRTGTWHPWEVKQYPCPAFPGPVPERVVPSSRPAHRAVAALRSLADTVTYSSPSIGSCDVAREAARVEAQVRGLEGDIDFCLTLARELGL